MIEQYPEKPALWQYFSTEDNLFSVEISNTKREGFTREQAEEIGPQVFDVANEIRTRGRYCCIPVKFGGEESYVHISSWGIVTKPRLRDGTHERTLDSSQILGFQTSDDW